MSEWHSVVKAIHLILRHLTHGHGGTLILLWSSLSSYWQLPIIICHIKPGEGCKNTSYIEQNAMQYVRTTIVLEYAIANMMDVSSYSSFSVLFTSRLCCWEQPFTFLNLKHQYNIMLLFAWQRVQQMWKMYARLNWWIHWRMFVIKSPFSGLSAVRLFCQHSLDSICVSLSQSVSHSVCSWMKAC